MPHWVETYPHTIWANVVLKDNKIVNWSVGERKWEHHFSMTRYFKVPFNFDDYKDEIVQNLSWEVQNDKEHNDVFEILAPEWFRQWEIHEDFKGSKPLQGQASSLRS